MHGQWNRILIEGCMSPYHHVSIIANRRVVLVADNRKLVELKLWVFYHHLILRYQIVWRSWHNNWIGICPEFCRCLKTAYLIFLILLAASALIQWISVYLISHALSKCQSFTIVSWQTWLISLIIFLKNCMRLILLDHIHDFFTLFILCF